MIRKPKNRAGVIGLGPIGSKAAAGLRAAGFSVYVWNRTPRAEPNFLGSAVEVVDLCEVVQLFLPHDAALIEVLRTVGAALRPEHVICGHATVAPDTARQAAALVEGCGARYLDAPFAGSRADAESRRLAYFVGGTEEALQAARPVLQATARRVIHVGGVGDAALLKLAAQTLNAVSVQGAAEALAVLRAGGGDPEKLREVLAEEPSHSALAAEKLAAMSAGRLDPVLPVRHVFRDLQVAMRLAGASRASVPAAGATAGILFGAVRRGQEDRDVAVIGVPSAALPAAAGVSGLSATVSVPALPGEAPEPAPPVPVPVAVAVPTARPLGSTPTRPSPTVSFVPLTPRQPPPQPTAEPASPRVPARTVSVPVAAMLAPLHRAAAAPAGTSPVPVLPAFRGHGPITNRISSPASSMPAPTQEGPVAAPSAENQLDVPVEESLPSGSIPTEEPAADSTASFDEASSPVPAGEAVEAVSPSDIRPPGLRPTGPIPTGSPGSRIGPPPRPRGWMKRLFGGPPAGKPST